MSTNTTRRNVIITDLDQSDNEQRQMEENHRKAVHKKRSREKQLQTLSGNFTRRSQSAECKPQERLTTAGKENTGGGDRPNKNVKHVSYFHDLVSYAHTYEVFGICCSYGFFQGVAMVSVFITLSGQPIIFFESWRFVLTLCCVLIKQSKEDKIDTRSM